jgi:hypothetical protein
MMQRFSDPNTKSGLDVILSEQELRAHTRLLRNCGTSGRNNFICVEVMVLTVRLEKENFPGKKDEDPAPHAF